MGDFDGVMIIVVLVGLVAASLLAVAFAVALCRGARRASRDRLG